MKVHPTGAATHSLPRYWLPPLLCAALSAADVGLVPERGGSSSGDSRSLETGTGTGTGIGDRHLEDPSIASWTTAGRVWPAGRALAELLHRRSLVDVRGQTVLELGSGTGVLGLAAARAGASHVVRTTATAPPLPSPVIGKALVAVAAADAEFARRC
eukprot:COSAG01_NODE_206_length_22034_cov_125.512585_17_plen_157_part_00